MARQIRDVATEIGQRAARIKPRLRGVIHQYAFFVCLIPGLLLVATAPTPRAAKAAAIYAVSVAALFGASALYHRITWSPEVRRWLSILDLSMIFVLIAGTYTPFALLVLDGPLADVVLYVVWGAAIVGTLAQLVLHDAPKWLLALIYVATGWIGVLATPQLLDTIGVAPVVLLCSGGVLYTIGAVIYALQRPDPLPTVFGYHEVFHVLVVAAAAIHFTTVAVWVLPYMPA